MALKHIIESLLFVNGEPISIGRLSKLAGIKKDAVEEALGELKNDYRDRGIVLIEKDGEVQFGTSPENKEWVEKLVKSEFTEDLTRAALETLAIIAYKGPLTRAEVEYIRGVNSSFTVRNLLMRGLVTRKENPKDARSYIYEISFDFLKHFGLKGPEELPEFEELRKKEMEMPVVTVETHE
ncbi:MAG: SMC-Scp complex subunit ScpB [Candidatus Sungbacteria bacterium]|nr:SMC-Scp complex subunit ScpB [Candidatus Sungbacteria bacterium]